MINPEDLEEMKRRRVMVERRMVMRTRRAYDNLLRTFRGNKKLLVSFLEWHLVAYMNYLDAMKVDEESARTDEYAEDIMRALSVPAFLCELPSLPFWTPSIVSEAG